MIDKVFKEISIENLMIMTIMIFTLVIILTMNFYQISLQWTSSCKMVRIYQRLGCSGINRIKNVSVFIKKKFIGCTLT